MKKIYILATLITILTSNLFAHEGHSNKIPWEVCNKKQKDEICSYEDTKHNLYIGTCQLFIDTLMCVRNKPIIKAKDR